MNTLIPERWQEWYAANYPERLVTLPVLKETIEEIAALEAQVKQLWEVLTIMHEAMDDKKGGTWIKARKWLDEHSIYHSDLQENAVLAEVCRVALAATEPKP